MPNKLQGLSLEKLYRVSTDAHVMVLGADSLEDFCFLPIRAYGGEPRWASPPASAARKLLRTDKNPFLLDAQHKCFIVYRHKLPTARVLVGSFRASGSAFFSLFEATDKESAISVLIAACAYARQLGAAKIVGPWPVDGAFAPGGLRIDGAALRPCYPNQHSYGWYLGCMADMGFMPYNDSTQWRFGAAADLFPGMPKEEIRVADFERAPGSVGGALRKGERAGSIEKARGTIAAWTGDGEDAMLLLPAQAWIKPAQAQSGLWKALLKPKAEEQNSAHIIQAKRWEGAREHTQALCQSLIQRAFSMGYKTVNATLPKGCEIPFGERVCELRMFVRYLD